MSKITNKNSSYHQENLISNERINNFIKFDDVIGNENNDNNELKSEIYNQKF